MREAWAHDWKARWPTFRLARDCEGRLIGSALAMPLATDVLRKRADLRFLLDTNILIHAEDHDIKPTPESSKAVSFLRSAQRIKGSLVVSGATEADFLRAPKPTKQRRLLQLSRYHVLAPISDISETADKLKLSMPLSPQDRCDLEILTVLERGAADILVTNDGRLRRRAERIGLGTSALDIDEANDMCSSLLAEPVELLSVKTAQPHLLSLSASIFDSLKTAYPRTDPNGGFETWWRSKVVGGDRDVLLIGAPYDPMAICVPKLEDAAPHKNVGRTLKLSPFKVNELHSGSRLGELLLRAAIEYAQANKCGSIYLEILPEQDSLIDWLSKFGFYVQSVGRTAKGELIVSKELIPVIPCGQANSLTHHIDHGPGHFCSTSNFVVPIQRGYHRRLFPEVLDGNQLPLPMYMQEHPCGNAIRKAYISGSGTNQLKPGDGLLFLQTQQKFTSSATAVGIVEETRRPKSLDELIGFIANRSVFTSNELGAWFESSSSPLAILFRLDRILQFPITTPTLLAQGVFKHSPQSIQRIPEGASKWFLNEINRQ